MDRWVNKINKDEGESAVRNIGIITIEGALQITNTTKIEKVFIAIFLARANWVN